MNLSKIISFTLLVALILIAAPSCGQTGDRQQANRTAMQIIRLPAPSIEGDMPLEEAIRKRRSVRSFSTQPIDLAALSQLCWAGQGITLESRGFRTVPSAGATFPLELFVVAANVTGVEKGLYRYIPETNRLELHLQGDIMAELLDGVLMQEWIREAAAIFVISAEYSRTTRRYGERGNRYVYMECGHVGQNISLQAIALGLGTTMVGAFRDDVLSNALNLPDNLVPLYVIPVGYPR